MRGDGAGAWSPHARSLHDEFLTERLRVLRAAVAVLRDPLGDPDGRAVLSECAFRAMPKPRATGRAESTATAAASTSTLTAAGVPQPSTPSDHFTGTVRDGSDSSDDDSARPDGGSTGEQPVDDDISVEIRAIVARAQGGDAEAFGELYDRYVDLVYRYIYYRVGAQALAEDLTSETFLRALRRITSFTWQGRDIGAWFVTIARNLIADHFKSGRYRLEVATADMLDADGVQEGPEDAVLDGITNIALLEAVKKLGPEQQECIVLRFLQGLSVAETALAMGKNDGAIKALQYRAVRALGRLLPEDLL